MKTKILSALKGKININVIIDNIVSWGVKFPIVITYLVHNSFSKLLIDFRPNAVMEKWNVLGEPR